jgi:regulator of extracellular matrix RemA (YlzA/DUF370 family)
MQEGKKRNQTVDAILYTSGKKAIAVKFTDTATVESKGLARVNKIEGVEVYVMSEPLTDYSITVDVSTGLKAKSYMTGGLVNNSVEEDVAQYVRRALAEAKDTKQIIDAVVYSGGKRSIGVTFK